ncbi:MAG: energy-coupled thiamine transporter ThiT [Erysipelotrichaceae bacterium]|nr:energy-coupled thiamine transporter ThiT [Erysipelotrichaceae bacterium]
MKKKNLVGEISEIAIMAALAFALDTLQGGIFRGLFPNGGSIGFAMLPILVITFRRGVVDGLISAFILSFLQMLTGIYAIADSWYMVLLQIMLDYVIAYPLVAMCGVFKKAFLNSKDRKQQMKYLILGCVVGGMLKLLSHYLAGVIFWSSSCPEGFLGGPALFSLVYNGEYMLPNIIINAALLCLILIKQPSILMINNGGNTNEIQAN